MSLLEYTRFAESKCWPRLHALPPAESYSKLTVDACKTTKIEWARLAPWVGAISPMHGRRSEISCIPVNCKFHFIAHLYPETQSDNSLVYAVERWRKDFLTGGICSKCIIYHVIPLYAERNGKLPHLFIRSKTANLVPEFAVENLPLSRTLTLVPEFAVKDLPFGRTRWWWWFHFKS